MRSIKNKITFMSVCIVTIASFIIACPVILLEYAKLSQTIQNTSEQTIDLTCANINNSLLRPVTIVKNVHDYILTQPDSKIDLETYLEKLIHDESEFSELYYSGTQPYKDGGFFYASDRWVPDADYDQTQRPWFLAGKSKDGISFSKPYIDIVTNALVATVTYGVKNEGVFQGVVGLDMRLTTLTKNIDKTKLTSSGLSYILDADGNYITNPDQNKILKINFFNDLKLEKYKNTTKKNKTYITLR